MSDSSVIPSGFKEYKGKAPFDIDSDDKELWLIRVPSNVSVEQLSNMKIQVPSHKNQTKSLGKLNLGDEGSFGLYQVPNEDQDTGISGQEMSGFTVMLPTKDGKLRIASKEVKHKLILDEQVAIPDSTEVAKEILSRPVEPRPQPDGLKMRFKPYGFDTGAPITTETKASNKGAVDKEEKKRKRSTEEGKEKKKKSKKSSA
ncbi:hypothetical protein K492DRAFT_177326 [Lichtheimia hyalospora FSU 10163]|nr:hypothetical protein K492DRAFT_177326 [Lichtheimia hyalospora FSU 10163]